MLPVAASSSAPEVSVRSTHSTRGRTRSASSKRERCTLDKLHIRALALATVRPQGTTITSAAVGQVSPATSR
jgi:hypothetical protein